MGSLPSLHDVADAQSIDLRKVLQALRKYRVLIVAVSASVFTLVALWTIKQPKSYEAYCTLEYDPNPPKPLGEEVEDVAQPVNSFFLTREFYETQNQVISSRKIAERVVRKLELHRDADFVGVPEAKRAKFEGVPIDEAANALRKRIRVKPVRDTRIVQIELRDEKPQRAAAIVNAIADAYVDSTVQDRLGTTVNALQWLQKQTDELRQQLSRSELALHQFKKDSNVLSVSLEDKQNIVTQQIETYSDSLTKARIRRIEQEAKLEQLKHTDLQDPVAHGSPILSSDESLMELAAKQQEKNAERAALSVKYGPSHPQVRALSVEVDQIRQDIVQMVRGLVAKTQGDLRESRGIENALERELDKAQQAGLELNLREIEYERLNRERENQAKLYGVLLTRSSETNLTRLLRTAPVRIVDRALAPKDPVLPRVGVNLAIGAIAGLLLGMLLALALSTLDRTIKSTADVEALQLPLLGVFPGLDSNAKVAANRLRRKSRRDDPAGSRAHDLIVHHQPRSSAAECCRTVRTNLTFMGADRSLDSLVITSAGPRDGKTTVATNLAIAVAQSGKRVLLIDTDMRRPRLHHIFNLSSEVGISSVLVADKPLAACVQKTVVPNLSVLPCGPLPPNPSELLHTPQFRALLQQTTEQYDRVIFDSPPLGAVTDAAIIAAQVDGALFVVKARQTTRDAMSAALRQLRDIGAHIVGAVLNHVNLSDQSYAYRGSYYQYYQRSDKELGSKPTTSQSQLAS